LAPALPREFSINPLLTLATAEAALVAFGTETRTYTLPLLQKSWTNGIKGVKQTHLI
jgi:hypothetical protein